MFGSGKVGIQENVDEGERFWKGKKTLAMLMNTKYLRRLVLRPEK